MSTDPPIDTSKDTTIVFRLGGGQCRRIIDVDIERAGAWPEVPPPVDSYEDGELRGTLLKHWIEPHAPSLTVNGMTLIYRVTAHYVYAMNRPPTLQEKLRVGVAPHTSIKQADPESHFDPTHAYGNEELRP